MGDGSSSVRELSWILSIIPDWRSPLRTSFTLFDTAVSCGLLIGTWLLVLIVFMFVGGVVEGSETDCLCLAACVYSVTGTGGADSLAGLPGAFADLANKVGSLFHCCVACTVEVFLLDSHITDMFSV